MLIKLDFTLGDIACLVASIAGSESVSRSDTVVLQYSAKRLMIVNNFDNYICMHHSVRFLSFLPRRPFLDSYSGSSAHHECYRYVQEQNISSRQNLRHQPALVDLTPPDIQTCKK